MISAIGVGHRRRDRPRQAPLRQDRHHDRRRRRRLAHPHAAADVLLSPDVRAGQQGGHVYVAQPPLFRVDNKKDTYYVQTEEEMKAQLLELGLADAVFEPGDGRTIDGEQMDQLCPHPGGAWKTRSWRSSAAASAFGSHALRQDPVSLKLPVYHVFLGSQEHWFTTPEQLRRVPGPAGRKGRRRAAGDRRGKAGFGRRQRPRAAHAAHRRAARSPLDQQHPGRPGQDGLLISRT